MKSNQTKPVRTSMFSVRCWMLNVAIFATAGSALADVRYVDVNSTNATPPYISWSTAATNIQDAVDAAVAGDEVVVTNGIYAAGGRAVNGSWPNRVAVDKPLRLRSVNGPQFTEINGSRDLFTGLRCVYLADGASLLGFTLANGFVLDYNGGEVGAGVACEPSAVVSNCVVLGNSVHQPNVRGLPSPRGGGASGGTLNNCILSDNGVNGDSGTFPPLGIGIGGGASHATLNNCTLAGNRADNSGGGAFGCILNNCTLTGNLAWFGYGGGAADCTLNNCTLTGNSANGAGGGAAFSTLNNCTLNGNSASGGVSALDHHFSYGPFGCGAYDSVLNNCTVVGNTNRSPWLSGVGGVAACTVNNCIVVFNSDTNCDSSSTLNYSCTMPLPTNGVFNITNAPLFVNSATGNYRLRPDSPCIDAGTNLSASITNDLDGRPRPLDGNGDGLAAFDMGAYEYRTPLLVWQDSPNPTPPHADWATAAHTIQDAVDAAVAGDEIVVTNGTYATGGRAMDGATNRVLIDKPVTVESVNGPVVTIIDGSQSVRCVYLTMSATLAGFTLTNGAALGLYPSSGGGAFCESPTAVISNCVVAGNRADSDGGVFGGVLQYCTLRGNSAEGGGGAGSCQLSNCRLEGNSAYNGGGAWFSTLNNCTLVGNFARRFGIQGGGFGGGALRCTLNNCTLVGNSATISGGGARNSTLNNSIAYFNDAAQSANYDPDFSTLNYSCTTPLPTNGVGNITNAPLFVDQASGNLRLQSNSPCINAGLNAFAPAGPDLDGNPRIRGDTVDIGAYEFQNPASRISYAWLQQFNLPINPSTDSADPDGDGVDNYHEWLAGSDPTNPFSFPPLLTLIPYGVNVILTWPTNAFGFALQSTTNLVAPPVWTTNSPAPVVIGGQNVVINPISGPQQFYRLSH